MLAPTEYRTRRLLLRAWRDDDAERLLPVLEANVEHLRGIPPHVAAPADVLTLRQRLSGYAGDFAAARAWRYALLTLVDERLMGEVSLFPRSASGRTQIGDADRVEIGYWLRADATGQGFATEAAGAALAIAVGIARFRHAEIRCAPGNRPSAAIPARLGFDLAATEQRPGPTPVGESGELQVWQRILAVDHGRGGASHDSAQASAGRNRRPV